MTTYKSIRIINGKPKKVIVDENGDVINNSPTVEEYEKNVAQIIRERRRYRPFEVRKPRLRSACPKCGSLGVKKNRDTYDYKCCRCGWKGETIIKIGY